MAATNKCLAQNNKSPDGVRTNQQALLGTPFVRAVFFSQMTRLAIVVLALACAACAGRDPQPVATVQATDANASCAMVTAEIEANNIKVRELAGEEGGKVAQNVVAGVAGVFIPVLWFGMDFKGAASKEVVALQARQQYLTTLASERCRGTQPAQQRR